MRYLLISCLVLFLVGCKAQPRYRTGGEELPPQVSSVNKSHMTTNENIRLGLILQSYLGKPYSGKSRYEEGLDCSYFTGEVYRKYNNIILPRTASDQFKEGSEVHFNHLKYGDLVFFQTTRKKISHVGIYVGDMRFIHVSSSRGVIVSSMKEKYWSERYRGARRIVD